MNNKEPRYQDIPVYEITFEEDGYQGIRMVSLVKDPAIELKGMYFSAEELKSEVEYQFKTLPEQQIIVGYAMLPNKKIIRKDDNGNPYFVVFRPSVIRQMADCFNKENSNKDINVDHGNEMVPGFIRENWITESEQYDKMRMYGFKPIVGGWAVIMHIEDKKFWKTKVKEEGRYSFSIEGLMGQEKANYSMEDLIDSLTEDELYQLFVNMDDIPLHPNCKCDADEYIWVCQPEACKHCLAAQKEYNRYTTAGDFETAKLIFEKHTGKKFKSK